MKTLLALTLLLTTTCTTANPWVTWDDPALRYRLDCDEPSSAVFIYHTASDDEVPDVGLQTVIEDLAGYCALIVLPLADRHPNRLLGNLRDWDMSDDFTHGADSAEQQAIINLVADVPVYLMGGSAGAIMAYKLANERRILGLLLAGLVMLDGLTPYGISADDQHTRYEGTEVKLRYSQLGLDYYTSDVDHVNLGFSNSGVRWELDTLIVNSVNDLVIPDDMKEEFVGWLSSHADNLQVNIEGRDHSVGPEGLAVVRAWFRERLN